MSDFGATMTQRFLTFIPFIFKWEGEVYENDPDDPGGATKFGIDQRSHPGEDIRHLTKERAEQIYWTTYWAAVRGDLLPPGVGEVCFNIAVNAGIGRASRWLQEYCGVVQDGNVGPKTIAAAEQAGAGLAPRLLDRMEEHYRSIAHGQLTKFLPGWLNRNNDLRQWIASHGS